MARKRRTRRDEPQENATRVGSEESAARRVASWVTFFLVSLITVVLGYAIGRYAIVNLLTDSLGLETPAQTGTQIIQSTRTEGTTSSVAGSSAQGSLSSVSTVREGQDVSPSAGSGTGAAPQSSVTQGNARGPASDGSAPSVPAAAPVGTPSQATGSQTATAQASTLYRVQVGGFATRDGADQLLAALKPTFPDAFVTFNTEYRVQVGAYSTAAGAEEVAKSLRAMGHSNVHVIAAN